MPGAIDNLRVDWVLARKQKVTRNMHPAGMHPWGFHFLLGYLRMSSIVQRDAFDIRDGMKNATGDREYLLSCRNCTSIEKNGFHSILVLDCIIYAYI